MSFQVTQRVFAGHLRNPDSRAPPGIEERRLAIYRDLIYNNIEGFIAGGFPVMKKILTPQQWRQLVRMFVKEHCCQTPYFLEIGREFLDFLSVCKEQGRLMSWVPPFLLELAHYEWVELALDVAEESLPEKVEMTEDLMDATIVLSPLVWPLAYQFPVHHISPAFLPQEPLEQPCCLVVYRNRLDQVRFLEVNPLVLTLIQCLEVKEENVYKLLVNLADELGHETPDTLITHGRDLIDQLVKLDILSAKPPG